jgi:phosphate transport system permease protein
MAERFSILALAITSAAALVLALFAWMMADILVQGGGELSLSYFLEGPIDAGRAGGIAPILVSTILIVATSMVVSLPLALGTAVLLAEFSRPQRGVGRLVRSSLDLLAGVPSIVFGLFGSIFFCRVLGLGFSILAGGLTLACMTLPIMTRSIELGLRALPLEQRLVAASLGFGRPATILRLLLPAAMPGLLAGVILGLGRAMAETAALIFTSGYVDRMPSSLLDSGRSLSIHIFDLAMNVPGGTPRAYAAALVLVGMLLIINLLSSSLGRSWAARGGWRKEMS